jgi:protein SCO1/2
MEPRRIPSRLIAAIGCLLALTRPVSGADPDAFLGDVGFDGLLDAAVPTSTAFLDEAGRRIELDDYLGTMPAVLILAYYRCQNLCSVVLRNAAESLALVDLEAGRSYQVIVISIDPREGPETAAEMKDELLAHYARPGDEQAWHFLTGTAEASAAVADSIGFRYVYDRDLDQYAHAAGITVLTPQGRASRYFYGVAYAPRDLQLGLVEAAGGVIGSPADRLLLLCYHYDPQTGKYGLAILGAVRIAAVATALAIAVALAWLLRREAGHESREARRR